MEVIYILFLKREESEGLRRDSKQTQHLNLCPIEQQARNTTQNRTSTTHTPSNIYILLLLASRGNFKHTHTQHSASKYKNYTLYFMAGLESSQALFSVYGEYKC
jgi:hypothetical protein